MKTTTEHLRSMGACTEAVQWAHKYDTWEKIISKCDRPDWLLWMDEKHGILDDKERRLLACYFVRHTPIGGGRKAWDLLTDERSRNAVRVAERYAKGLATSSELAAAGDAAWAAAGDAAGDAAWAAAGDAAGDAAWDAAGDAAGAAAWAAAGDAAWAAAWAAARAAAGAAARAAAGAAARAAARAAAGAHQAKYIKKKYSKRIIVKLNKELPISKH